MTIWQAILLGVVQGLTEFFPVSSSAHLQLVSHLLGVSATESLLSFSLVCHFGTLVALLWFLKMQVVDVLRDRRRKMLYLVATLPLVPAYFLFRPLCAAMTGLGSLGWALLCTAGLLFLAIRKRSVRGAPAWVSHDCPDGVLNSIEEKWRDALFIGVAQVAAFMPGISRSGSTIAIARLLGWDWVTAARFSFILAIPTILGGQMVECVRIWSAQSDGPTLFSWHIYAVGWFTALVTGLGSVRMVFWVYERGKVYLFAGYCTVLALLLLLLAS